MGATAAIAIAKLAGAYSQGEAEKIRGSFEQQQFEMNARFSDLKARETMRRGDKDAARHGKTIRTLVGKQRASLAGQGVQVDSGTAAEIQEQTLEVGREEMETIKNNAWREAFGYKQSALADRISGKMAKGAADFNARNTLVAGGLNALDNYSRNSFKDKKKIKAKPNSSDAIVAYDPHTYGQEKA